jgi:hypothetical protein
MLMDLIEDDSRPIVPWPYWNHVRSWWAVRDQPNVLFVHFADLKKDLEGEMRRIAEFLDITNLTDEQWKAAVEHCGFAWMKEHAEMYAPPMADISFKGGAKEFINKGTNGVGGTMPYRKRITKGMRRRPSRNLARSVLSGSRKVARASNCVVGSTIATESWCGTK